MIFDSIDGFKAWCRDVGLAVEVTYRVRADLPWKVRFADVHNGAHRPQAEGEDLADAFEGALLRYDGAAARDHGGDVPEPVEGRLDGLADFEDWCEQRGATVNLVYRARELPRFWMRVGHGEPVVGATIDAVVVAAEELA